MLKLLGKDQGRFHSALQQGAGEGFSLETPGVPQASPIPRPRKRDNVPESPGAPV